MNVCKCCQTPISPEWEITREVYNGYRWMTLYFCSHDCKTRWYVGNLRKSGL